MTTLASLFNLAGPDLLIIFFVILLMFGAKKLPELARGLGQAIREFSKAKDDFTNEITRPAPPEPPRQIDEPKAPVTEDPHATQTAQHAQETAGRNS